VKTAGLLALGWLIPGGGFLLLGRRGQFAIWFLLVTGLFTLGLLNGGGGTWLKDGELEGTDALGAAAALGGLGGKLLAGGPYLGAILAGFAPGYVEGRLHDYATTLLTFAGFLNLLALASAWEARHS
jgi:hypothetical protein